MEVTITQVVGNDGLTDHWIRCDKHCYVIAWSIDRGHYL